MKNSTAEKHKEMAEKYKEGVTVEELAQQYGLAKGSVRNYIRPFLDSNRKRSWGKGAKNRYTKRNNEIKAKYIKGASAMELALSYGVTERTVLKILQEDPETEVMARRKIASEKKEERDKEMAEKYKAGATLEELSAKYGLATSTIWNYIYIYVPRELISERNEWMYEKYKAGATVEELAEEYGLAVISVYGIIRKLQGGGSLTRKYTARNVAYPRLAEWMEQHCYNKHKFYTELINNSDGYVAEGTFVSMLTGKTDPSFKMIKMILMFTGLGFAEAFYRDEQD